MLIPFLTLPFAIHLTIFVADSVPKMDVTASCRAAAATAANAADRNRSCLDSEQSAHDLLVKEWSDFSPVDRANCMKALTFEPTYTELLTCLEMARDVKK